MSTLFRRTLPSTLARRANPLASVRYLSASAISMARISDAVKQDHRELQEAYQHIVASTDVDQRTRWRNQFVWELARHSIAEELLLYPALEKHVPNGQQMADRDREQHQVIKNQLKHLQNMDTDDAEFMPTLQTLEKALTHHIRDEEHGDLVAMEAKLTERESEAMSRSFERTKMLTPTRSHPNAPDKPPFETVAGLMAAPIDKIADLFRKWPDQRAV